MPVIEIKDIVDQDSLQQWLTEWPASQGLEEDAARQIAVTIAHRAAMRVMPYWWQYSLTKVARKRELTALPILRSLLISRIAAKIVSPEIRAAAAAAAAAATTYAANAADDTAYAAAVAAYAAAAYTIATDAAETAWDSIRAECEALSKQADVFGMPLWGDQRNPLEPLWSEIKLQASAPEWEFWIIWYNVALAGYGPNLDMLEEIALIKSEVWDAGPVIVAAEIKKIEQKYEAQKPVKPNAILIQNAVAQNLPAIPPQIDALIETINAEIERLRGKNPQDDLEKKDIDRLIETFKTMRSAVIGLSELLPLQGAPVIEDAEEMGGLLQLYGDEFRKWPKENAAELVDSSCRIVLIGLTAGVMTAFGLPALASTAVAGIAFGGKKLVGIGKVLKDTAPKGD